MTKNIAHVDWEAIFYNSALDIFRISVPKKPKTRLVYDFAVQIDEVLLLFLVADAKVAHEQGVIYDKAYQQAYYQIAQSLAQRHKKCLKNLPNAVMQRALNAQSLHPQKYDSKNLPQVFFIGISSLISYHIEEKYLIGYEFNSAFFEEKFVFDRENAYQLLQLFSLHEWQVLLDLFTPTDLYAFLKYHRQAMIEGKIVNSSVRLAQEFLRDRKFFERAWQIEKNLQTFDYLPRVSPRIQQAIYKKQTVLDTFPQKLQTLSHYWLSLIEELIHRQQQANRPPSLEVLRKLVLQSSYTRLKILEPVLAYPQFSATQITDGMLYHEHSYHRLGQHFVVIIYGSNADSELYPTQVYRHYSQILQTIAKQLVNNAISDLFLLGFNLLNKDKDNHPFIEMDVFYQKLVS